MRTIKVKCISCGRETGVAVHRRQAAPMLVALEHLEPDGWSYRLGFFSMMTGDYYPRCPSCTEKNKQPESAHLR